MPSLRSWRAMSAVVLAASINIGLLIVPALVIQSGQLERLLTDLRCLVLLAGATLLLLADAASLTVAAEDRAATEPIDRRQHKLALLTGLLLWGTLAGGLATLASDYSCFTLIAGGALMLLGAGLRFVAIITLRRQFTSGATVDREERRLVQHGLFRFVRHPSETGLLAFAIGVAVLLGSPIAAIGAGALFITTLVRIRWEDEQLARAWPAEFNDYRERVPAILPYRTTRKCS